MSQFNSGADLERAFPRATTQRTRLVAPGRPGIEESLAAPGLVTQPAVSRGAILADQTLTALGIVGAAGQAIGVTAEGIAADRRRQSEETRIRLERQEAERKRLSNEIDQQYRGQGRLHARTRAPVLETAIAAREMLVPEGVSVEEHVRALVASETEGFSAPYAEAYGAVLAPQLAQAFARQQQNIKTEAKAESLRLLGEAAINAGDATGIREQMAAAKALYPDLTDTDILATVTLPALETAAASGDAAKTAAAIEALGDRFPAERARAVATLATQQSQQARLREDAARQDVFRLINEGQPFDVARQRVEALRKSGDLPEDSAAALNSTITAREEESGRESLKLLLQQEVRTAEDQTIAAVENAMLSAGESGGAAIVDDVTFTGSDGREHTFTRRELVEAATTNAMQRLEQTASSPEEAFAGQVEFLSRNGETFPLWERTMAAGYVAVASDFAADPTKPLPANVAAGYDIFRRMAAMNPRLARSHLKDSGAQAFYETAALAEKYVTPGEPNAALLMAAKAFSRPSPFSAEMAGSLGRKEFDAALKDARTRGWGFWKSTAKNDADFGGKIEQVARLYVQALGLNPSDAIAEAAKKVKESHVNVNDWAIDIGNRRVPAAFPDIAKRAAEEYAARHPDEVRADDLVIVPGETDASWILFDMRALAPVENWRTEGFYTNADLDRLNAGYSTADQQAVINKVIQNAADRRDKATKLREALSRGELPIDMR